MPDEVDPVDSGEQFLLPPSATAAAGKALSGLQEAHIAAQILSLIKTLPKGTPGVAEIKAGAIKLAHTAGEKLSKAK